MSEIHLQAGAPTEAAPKKASKAMYWLIGIGVLAAIGNWTKEHPSENQGGTITQERAINLTALNCVGTKPNGASSNYALSLRSGTLAVLVSDEAGLHTQFTGQWSANAQVINVEFHQATNSGTYNGQNRLEPGQFTAQFTRTAGQLNGTATYVGRNGPSVYTFSCR